MLRKEAHKSLLATTWQLSQRSYALLRRPRLTAAALAVQLMVPVIRIHRGLAHPNECAPAGRTNKKAFQNMEGLFSEL